MQVNIQTIVRYNITLDKSEEFVVKPPGTRRKWWINLIQVHDGYFFLFGGTRFHSGACMEINHGYRSVSEVPTMPTYVAKEVIRALETLAKSDK